MDTGNGRLGGMRCSGGWLLTQGKALEGGEIRQRGMKKLERLNKMKHGCWNWKTTEVACVALWMVTDTGERHGRR